MDASYAKALTDHYRGLKIERINQELENKVFPKIRAMCESGYYYIDLHLTGEQVEMLADVHGYVLGVGAEKDTTRIRWGKPRSDL